MIIPGSSALGLQAGRASPRNRNAESRSNRGAPSLAQAVDRVGPHREGRPSRDGPRLTRFGFVYGASTFTPCASKSKTLPRSSYSRAAAGEVQAEREGSPYVVKALRHPDLRHYPIGGNGWPLPQSSDPPIPMLRGVCIAITASANVGTRGIWASPALLLAPSAYSQKAMGASQISCGSTASGGSPH